MATLELSREQVFHLSAAIEGAISHPFLLILEEQSQRLDRLQYELSVFRAENGDELAREWCAQRDTYPSVKEEETKSLRVDMEDVHCLIGAINGAVDNPSIDIPEEAFPVLQSLYDLLAVTEAREGDVAAQEYCHKKNIEFRV